MAALDLTFGLLFVAFTIATCLYGVTILQCYTYFRTYNDNLLLKYSVVLVLLLDTAGTACSAQGLYSYLITNYGNPLALADINIGLCVESMITVIITFVVQCFFANSVWSVTDHNVLVTGFIAFTSFAALVIGLAMSTEDIIRASFASLSESRFKILAGLDLGIAALCDIAITATLCYHFHYRKNGFRSTDTLLDKLSIYTLNRGILTFIVQTLNMVLFITSTTMAWTLFHLCLSKVYMISFLATLNRRESLKRADHPSLELSGNFQARLHDSVNGSHTLGGSDMNFKTVTMKSSMTDEC
ncbi:hypothetical protein SERLA73DRAFT_190557 [Serpula lacrymans var. lacrymans S7.3]|uniref:DUF6534 domain-containing protein n=2 Tax=Serpula lacrymans var. lacrymans TaxID=341189 RepID=F8QFU6_SERL3|nr:uncharacterized protein SERLADRAFT_481096 [Serpula lacrymans var. lacrymans S7.9]EGN92836.1 hypothetical protein SERLA73DRAFT_190557 [Serpula lacrymans var. lacrymans S7.3]EGO18516.1 hypothetical protein SERLADRAFT_481096 [Serpula lacrymans var. lacrymans S7.9]